MKDARAQAQADVLELLTSAGIGSPAEEAEQIVEAAARVCGNADLVPHARALAADRTAGTPLAYVTGQTTFMGVRMAAAPGALVPRDETELLGRTALEYLRELPGDARVIDMCCGSGNLACGLASHLAAARVWASDLTEGAVAVARANVARLGLADRVTVYQGDLFGPLTTLRLEGSIDVVVCNPPYISSGKLGKERVELLEHEPREAFDGGPYGVSIFQRVVRDAPLFLRRGGRLLLEIGAGQDRQVAAIFGRAGAYGVPEIRTDASGMPRVVVGRTQ